MSTTNVLNEWYRERWPASAEKVEMFFGAIHWQGGPWDERDVAIARRTYPAGWRIELGYEGSVISAYAPGGEGDSA
jgi:hypothetical protein